MIILGTLFMLAVVGQIVLDIVRNVRHEGGPGILPLLIIPQLVVGAIFGYGGTHVLLRLFARSRTSLMWALGIMWGLFALMVVDLVRQILALS